MKRLSRPWTAAEDKRLLELIAKGKRRYIVAVKLKRSTSSVVGRLKVLRNGKPLSTENAGMSRVAEV